MTGEGFGQDLPDDARADLEEFIRVAEFPPEVQTALLRFSDGCRIHCPEVKAWLRMLQESFLSDPGKTKYATKSLTVLSELACKNCTMPIDVSNPKVICEPNYTCVFDRRTVSEIIDEG